MSSQKLTSTIAAQGVACVVVSSDFEEVAELCDRVLVFNRGRLATELAGSDLGVSALTTWATGAADRPASLGSATEGPTHDS